MLYLSVPNFRILFTIFDKKEKMEYARQFYTGMDAIRNAGFFVNLWVIALNRNALLFDCGWHQYIVFAVSLFHKYEPLDMLLR